MKNWVSFIFLINLIVHPISLFAGNSDLDGSRAGLAYQHGAGKWFFNYRFENTNLKGLLNGKKTVDTTLVSGSVSTGAGVVKDANKAFMMAPTKMTTNNHVLEAMYGFSDWFALMGVVNYKANNMDLVMHMEVADGSVSQLFGSVNNSGAGDSYLAMIFQAGERWTASLTGSFPTGSIDEKVDIIVKTEDRNLSNINAEIQAPYVLQLGSGTQDLIPSINYHVSDYNTEWGANARYIYRGGENANGYVLGNQTEFRGWVQWVVNNTLLMSFQLRYKDWNPIEGRDELIEPILTSISNPEAYGGTRFDATLGAAMFMGADRKINFQIGVPLQQDLNGPQLNTSLLINFSIQVVL